MASGGGFILGHFDGAMMLNVLVIILVYLSISGATGGLCKENESWSVTYLVYPVCTFEES